MKVPVPVIKLAPQYNAPLLVNVPLITSPLFKFNVPPNVTTNVRLVAMVNELSMVNEAAAAIT